MKAAEEEAEMVRKERAEAEKAEKASAEAEAKASQEAEKGRAKLEEEAPKAKDAAAKTAEQRAAAKAARLRHLHKFLVAAYSEERFDKLTNYGIESVEDLCLATADDLVEAGVTKPFHQRNSWQQQRSGARPAARPSLLSDFDIPPFLRHSSQNNLFVCFSSLDAN